MIAAAMISSNDAAITADLINVAACLQPRSLFGVLNVWYFVGSCVFVLKRGSCPRLPNGMYGLDVAVFMASDAVWGNLQRVLLDHLLMLLCSLLSAVLLNSHSHLQDFAPLMFVHSKQRHTDPCRSCMLHVIGHITSRCSDACVAAPKLTAVPWICTWLLSAFPDMPSIAQVQEGSHREAVMKTARWDKLDECEPFCCCIGLQVGRPLYKEQLLPESGAFILAGFDTHHTPSHGACKC